VFQTLTLELSFEQKNGVGDGLYLFIIIIGTESSIHCIKIKHNKSVQTTRTNGATTTKSLHLCEHQKRIKVKLNPILFSLN